MCNQPTPEELLQSKLNELEKALRKSKEFLDKGKIDEEIHQMHKNNLQPKISRYKAALRIINTYAEWD
jgi:ribosomal protein S21